MMEGRLLMQPLWRPPGPDTAVIRVTLCLLAVSCQPVFCNCLDCGAVTCALHHVCFLQAVLSQPEWLKAILQR